MKANCCDAYTACAGEVLPVRLDCKQGQLQCVTLTAASFLLGGNKDGCLIDQCGLVTCPVGACSEAFIYGFDEGAGDRVGERERRRQGQRRGQRPIRRFRPERSCR
jgi:hypothetical protein